MTDNGLASELPFANVTRYEINARPHANLVCRKCGDDRGLRCGRR